MNLGVLKVSRPRSMSLRFFPCHLLEQLGHWQAKRLPHLVIKRKGWPQSGQYNLASPGLRQPPDKSISRRTGRGPSSCWRALVDSCAQSLRSLRVGLNPTPETWTPIESAMSGMLNQPNDKTIAPSKHQILRDYARRRDNQEGIKG